METIGRNAIQRMVDDKLEERNPREPGIPISFRGHKFTVMDLDILAKVLGYSTRSKLLSDLVPAAIGHVFEALPKELKQEFNELHTKAMESGAYMDAHIKGSKKK